MDEPLFLAAMRANLTDARFWAMVANPHGMAPYTVIEDVITQELGPVLTGQPVE